MVTCIHTCITATRTATEATVAVDCRPCDPHPPPRHIHTLNKPAFMPPECSLYFFPSHCTSRQYLQRQHMTPLLLLLHSPAAAGRSLSCCLVRVLNFTSTTILHCRRTSAVNRLVHRYTKRVFAVQTTYHRLQLRKCRRMYL